MKIPFVLGISVRFNLSIDEKVSFVLEISVKINPLLKITRLALLGDRMPGFSLLYDGMRYNGYRFYPLMDRYTK